jgi:hypothetical protein
MGFKPAVLGEVGRRSSTWIGASQLVARGCAALVTSMGSSLRVAIMQL